MGSLIPHLHWPGVRIHPDRSPESHWGLRVCLGSCCWLLFKKYHRVALPGLHFKSTGHRNWLVEESVGCCGAHIQSIHGGEGGSNGVSQIPVSLWSQWPQTRLLPLTLLLQYYCGRKRLESEEWSKFPKSKIAHILVGNIWKKRMGGPISRDNQIRGKQWESSGAQGKDIGSFQNGAAIQTDTNCNEDY